MKHLSSIIIVLSISGMIGLTSCHSRKQVFQPDFASLEKANPAPEWFKDAKFGIYFHWDNPDGTIERGYAGHSIFWRKGEGSLTVTYADKLQWMEYARSNASVGIKVYLSVRFSSPSQVDGLKTSDPFPA